MNSIRRARKRPRVKSCSFLTFGWLLIHEGAWRVITRTDAPEPNHPVREHWATLRSDQVRRTAEAIIHHDERRRYFP